MLCCGKCRTNVQEEVGDWHTRGTGVKIRFERSTPELDKQIGNCMVCGLGLGRKDDVVWCRHCGRLAHRVHLIEWVLTKKCCPACGNKLEEASYR